MSRRANQNAASAIALGAASTPSTPKLAGGALGEAGSRVALAELSQAMSQLKQLAARPLLQRAVAALQADDWEAGGKWAAKALEKDEQSGFGWYLMGIARERAGDFASSVQAYECALKLLPDHREIANDLGRLAYRLGMKVQAEKLFRHYLDMYPDNHEVANNLACTLRDQNRMTEAIEILRPAIMNAPEVATLWNTMGSIVAASGDMQNAETFYLEALRLDPGFAKARYNYGNARLESGDAEGALEACNAALTGDVSAQDRQMILFARSTILLALGKLGEGWDGYEARLHPDWEGRTGFLIDRPRWQPGDRLGGKSLLVVGEQGLGDEIFFANTLSDVIERLGPQGHLTLAVNPNLVALFRRSFPCATVGAHATFELGGYNHRAMPFLEGPEAIDLWTPMGSLLREFRRDVAAFPARAGFMTADPARVAHWRGVLEKAPPGRKVGLLWKSALVRDGRARLFCSFEQWAPVLATNGISFVNLQYGDCTDELAWAERELGVRIWTPPEIDLKKDLDDVAALGCAMDLVLGFSNASYNLAAACGAPVWLITTPGAWSRLGQPDSYPWYPQTRVFAPEILGDWETTMADVAKALAEFAAGKER